MGSTTQQLLTEVRNKPYARGSTSGIGYSELPNERTADQAVGGVRDDILIIPENVPKIVLQGDNIVIRSVGREQRPQGHHQRASSFHRLNCDHLAMTELSTGEVLVRLDLLVERIDAHMQRGMRRHRHETTSQ